MADAWADFRLPLAPAAAPPSDPWAEFRAPAASPAAAAEQASPSMPPTTGRPAEPQQPLGDAWGAKGEFLNGATFGLVDELGAALFTPIEMGIQAYQGEPLSISAGYDTALGRQREAQDAYRKDHPVEATAAGLAGGLFTGAGAAPKILSSGASLGTNIVRGTIAGGAGGAAAGFGEGRGMQDRVEDAILGGGIGAGLGAVAPLAGAAVGAGIRRIGAGRAARETLEPVGIGRRTADQIGRELDRDALSPEAARTRLDAMGPDAMLLDAGDNLAGGAEAVANAPGAGNRTIRERLAARNAGASQRITEAADAAIGPARDMTETADDLIARRGRESGPLYAQALEKPIGWNDRMQAFMDDPITKGGLRKGLEIQRLEALARNERFDPVDYNITDFNVAGDPIITGTPNMRTLNVIKKGLDNIVEGYRDPTTGRLQLDEYGRAVNEVQRAFIKEIDGLNPAYAAARAAWAGPTRVRDALALGQDVFDRSVRPDQLRQRLAAMGDDERQAFQMGARDQLSEIMGTARRDAGAARAAFETGWNREKLGLLLGDDEAAGRFLDTLGTETRFANRSNAITGNSATARRQERVGEYNGQRGAARGALDPASGLWGDTKRTIARGVDAILDGRAARSAEQMRGEFGDAVSRQSAQRDELIDAIMGYGRGREAAAQRAIPKEELMRAIMSGGALAVSGSTRRGPNG
ncbi:hypothetical protein GCM10011390_44070 [Aureimonas endophytica]|uniref:Uncharacterized protein n=1 Tax=Aureimonas endophytica TaxID=2027858 RepID=A0A916ZZB5_9HYPH|nr:hypothetical protein [Aureimonas endophytica]GGE19994.1 hypothetical protein GCM10011390_44070 [Aureimonas endophytica]